jgi:hypothetical protein
LVSFLKARFARDAKKDHSAGLWPHSHEFRPVVQVRIYAGGIVFENKTH